MRVPNYLTDPEAKSFFKRHLQECQDNGSLTDETLDAYVLLCRTWGYLCRCDPDADSKAAMKYASLMKYFQLYGSGFGVCGAKKPPGKPKQSLQDILRLNAKQA